mgnify:CR=1 FL=1
MKEKKERHEGETRFLSYSDFPSVKCQKSQGDFVCERDVCVCVRKREIKRKSLVIKRMNEPVKSLMPKISGRFCV